MNSTDSYVELFFEMMLAERAVSKNTLDAYKNDLNGFYKFTNRDIQSVNVKEIREYVSYLKASGVGSLSINRKISCLRQFYGFLVSEKVRDDDPTSTVDSLRRSEKLPRYLTEGEI